MNADDRKRGRPSIYGTPVTTVLKVRVTVGQHLVLRREASRRGLRVSDVIREALDEHTDPDPGIVAHTIRS